MQKIARTSLIALVALAASACGVGPVGTPMFVPGATASLVNDGAAFARGGSITGDVRVIKHVASRFLQQPRDVWVYLPPGYDKATTHYPVLYMHDGNNIFDGSQAFGGHEWQADETAERLIRAGELPPMIIVGAANTSDRMDEYTWVPGQLDGKTVGGAGGRYADFLTKELKPLIDKTYRTKPDRTNTGVLGSSLGGLESFYLGRYDADTYGKIGCMSPSIWWSDRAMLEEVPKFPRNLKVWLDMGWKEGNSPDEELANARDLEKALEGRGYKQGQDLGYYEDKEGGHNEQAWAYRLPFALKFLFGN